MKRLLATVFLAQVLSVFSEVQGAGVGGAVRQTCLDVFGKKAEFTFMKPTDPLVRRLLIKSVEKLTGVAGPLNDFYQEAVTTRRPDETMWDAAARVMNIKPVLREGDLARIPAEGPLVIVANHPIGGAEAILGAHVLGQVRKDFKFMSNEILLNIPVIAEDIFAVNIDDPKDEADALRIKKLNREAMLKAIRHVRGGGALFVFPAGEVSTAPSTMGRAVDREWPEQIAQLVVGSKAQVVPFFFDDQNGPLFQWVSRYLGARASLFPRQTMRRAGTQMTLRIGRALQPGVRPAAKDNGPRHYFNSNEELIRFLQTLAYLHDQHFDDPEKIYDNRRWSSVRAVRQLFRNLRRRDAPSGLIERKMADIVSAVPARVLEESVAAVLAADPSSLLVDNRELQVFLIRRNAMTEPIIREIGRQREETFRLVGEGSGKSIDLDEYDDTYLHMFIWHKVDRQIAGAYRLGVVDELIGAKQLAGLYTHLFFDYDSRFIDRIGNAVELGRSYVYHPYQISRTGLLIFNSLWEAIARFLARNPNIDSLFGPVSISGDYSTYSKLLVTQFLERHHGGDAETKALIAPRVPFERRPGTAVDHRLNEFVDTLVDIFSPTVDAADNDGLLGLDFVVKSIDDKAPLPPLVKHYTKLGAKYFAFSVDHDFHTVDGLIVVDVDRIPKRTLERYLGDEAAVAYQQRRINFRNASPR